MTTAGVGQGVPVHTASLKGQAGGSAGRPGVGEAASTGVRVAAGVPGTVEDDAGVGVLVTADTHRRGGRGGSCGGALLIAHLRHDCLTLRRRSHDEQDADQQPH